MEWGEEVSETTAAAAADNNSKRRCCTLLLTRSTTQGCLVLRCSFACILHRGCQTRGCCGRSCQREEWFAMGSRSACG